MFLKPFTISEDLFVSDIVRLDYRTARVFSKHGIDFCCGGKWAIGTVCELKGLNFSEIRDELDRSVKTVQLSNSLRFDDWSMDFLIDYIINIHHRYLHDEMPGIKEQLDHFTEGHSDKFLYLKDLRDHFNYLCEELEPHMLQEEEILFPYIRQIAHAYRSKEAYAGLLVRTLRKPVKSVMEHEHDMVLTVLQQMRKLTHQYQAPENSCISHRVTFSLLKELDNDLIQHLYLENQVLFPKAINMEKELLTDK